MSKLLPDNIVGILTYLPVKSLIRFKCACKSWRSLISDPQFAKLHLKRAEEENNGINHERLLVATKPLYSVDFEAASDGNNHSAIVELRCPNSVSHGDSFSVGMFLGSCNGLVCILDQVDDMVLWNPSTRDSKVLPKPSSSFHNDFSYGLGYDSSADDYKIVVVSTTIANGRKQIVAEIFTRKTNTWKKVIQGICPGVSLRGQGIFLNGALHWLGKQESRLAKVDVIVSFDAAEEKFMEFVPLPFPSNHFRTECLGLSGNCLCLFGEHGYPNESCFEAWIASECDINKPWRRLFSAPGKKTIIDYCTAVMCLTKNGEVLFDRGGCPEAVLEFYDPEKDARKWIRIQHGGDPFHESIAYAESLFPVNDAGACDF